MPHLDDCLTKIYGVDIGSTQLILSKLKPLIDKDECHATLDKFVELSASLRFTDQVSDILTSEGLPADDGTIIDPEHHKVLFENHKVRILWGLLLAGATEPLHRHYWPSLLIMIVGTTFEVTYADGKTALDDSPIDVYKLQGDIQAASYKNTGPEESSWLRFEIK